MFINVFTQVVILLVLMCVGFVLTKSGMLTKSGVASMTDLVLYSVTPCVIAKSFMRRFDRETLKMLIISFLLAIATHILFIALSRFLLRSQNPDKRRLLRFATIFTNCGFMSLPLQEAILGSDGVFYCASYIAMFNIILWSYGILLMSGDKKYITPKKLLVNPGIIGFVVGLVIFLFSIPIPEIISKSIGYMSSLNTPLPMIIIGYHLANSDFKKILFDKTALFSILIRLVLFPMIVLAILYMIKLDRILAVSIVISAAAPSATMGTMFAAKFNPKPDLVELSVGVVSFSTVLSLITMPLIISLAQIAL